MSDVLFWLLVTCNTTYACKTTSPFIVGGEIRLLHTSSGPTSSQFDTSGFEKPVAFGKVSGNSKLHCELRYFHLRDRFRYHVKTFSEVVAGSPGSPVEESWVRKFQEEDEAEALEKVFKFSKVRSSIQ